MSDKEEQLIISSQQGDILSFERLISIYQQKIFNIAYFKIQNSALAEDITQEVIVRIFKKIKSFKFKSSFSSWVYRITCNIINDVVKKFKNISEMSIDEVENLGYDDEFKKVENSLEEDIKSEKIKMLISKIPHKFQIVLILYEVEGKTYEEIAEILNKNINTVKTRLYRARRILKDLILKEAEEILE